MSRHTGANGTGGTRPALRVDPEAGSKAIGPCAEHIAMAQTLIAARDRLQPSSLRMAQQMARDAHTRPLSAGQVRWLTEGLAHLGIVVAVPAPSFGPLPMRPPARLMA